MSTSITKSPWFDGEERKGKEGVYGYRDTDRTGLVFGRGGGLDGLMDGRYRPIYHFFTFDSHGGWKEREECLWTGREMKLDGERDEAGKEQVGRKRRQSKILVN